MASNSAKRTLTDFWGTADQKKSKGEHTEQRDDEVSDRKIATPTVRRKIKPEWFRRFSWLRFEKQLFMCDWCIKSGRTNVFTTGKKTSTPKADDFVKHERSAEHRFAESARSSARNEEMPRAAATAYNAVKDAVVATMRNVYFIAKEDLPKTKVKSVTELCDVQGCKSLDVLRQDDRVTYMHSASTDEFIDCIADIVERNVIGRMKAAKFYSLELDESTDIAVCQNLMIYIRGVVDGKVESHFLSVSMLTRATSEQLHLEVKGILSKKGLSLSNLISLGTDGASTMTGSRQGLTTRFKKDNPFILSQHCAAHKLALASGQAADCVSYLVKYQATVNDLYKYYHYSPKNQTKLSATQACLGESQLKYQQVFSTRWLSFYDSVSAICRTLDSLISALKDDVEQNKTMPVYQDC
ncbi:zinc finger protein 862-like [Ptychodera flava]|uniref:zinc finger protein 862-like n=1 Tax=Ptychodera flava TaxID=63121 RepID=UPI003969BE70